MALDYTPEFCTQLRDYYVQGFEKEHQTTVNIVAAMPDDGLSYRPHADIMEFANLARHIAGTGAFFVKMIREGQASMDPPPEPGPLPTKTSVLVEEVRGLFAQTLSDYKGLTTEQLSKPIDFFGMGAIPGVCYLGWDHGHLVHHRGQLGMYLRVAGHKVPSVYGPTLDVSFEDMMSNCED